MMRVPSRQPHLAPMLLLCSVAWLGCAKAAPTQRAQPSSTPPPTEPIAAPEVDWAAHVGEAPAGIDQQPSAAGTANGRSVLPSIMADHGYESDEAMPVRHLVYRVAFIVPPALRGRRPSLLAPAGELHVDVAVERLRARFVGPGWPLEDGTEVRLRADVPGAYLFDGAGGRPLAPGQLASWFQGHEAGHAKANVYVRREPGLHDSGPGELMCALLAEWSAQDREELAPRCQGGAMPPSFRLGLWTAELTAIVPITLPRRRLRADAGDALDPITPLSGRPMLEASDVERLQPLRMRGTRPQGTPAPVVGDGADEGSATIDVDNRTDARIVIVAQGVPVGWVSEHSRVALPGFTPGHYRVGAVRPFGQPAMTPTLLRVPGTLRFGKVDARVDSPGGR